MGCCCPTVKSNPQWAVLSCSLPAYPLRVILGVSPPLVGGPPPEKLSPHSLTMRPGPVLVLLDESRPLLLDMRWLSVVDVLPL